MLAHEPLRMALVGGGEYVGTHGLHRFGASVVDIDRMMPGDPGVAALGATYLTARLASGHLSDVALHRLPPRR